MTTKCPKCHIENLDNSKFCSECGLQLDSADWMPVAFTETIETPVEELTRGTAFANRYEIIEELGKGGMGRVYRVEDTRIKEEVALKLIKPEVSADKKTIERFSNELKFARKIAHRNVCKMYDLGEDQGTHYITMEYIPGEDLKSMIRMSGQLGIGTAINIAKQVCEGLSEAHRLGVVHRDLKPNNIMIDKGGNARIMDFGIARSLSGKGITGAGVMIGTPEYMSPEQVEGKEIDQRSDIYSLGIILYEMLTGRLPFEGDTPFTVGVKHKSEEPEDPQKYNSRIPDDLSRMILKCLAKNKEARYQSAGEVRSELEQIEKGMPTTERRAPIGKTLTSKEITVSFRPAKLLIPALIVIAIVVIGLVIWHPWSQDGAILTPTDKPSLAVLYFENNSGNEGLDHWRSGLCEMLITDLSQSKYIHVLSGDQVYSILERFNLLDKAKYSTEDLRKVASRGGANHVLRGNYITAGDKFIINISLLKANTGEIISSLREEALGEANITDSVDIITRKVKSELNISPEQIASDIDKDVGEVTTKSPEAYKYYVEGIKHDIKGDYPKVIESMKKAIEIDPEFASAYRAMSWSYSNQGYYAEGKEYIQKALELSNRLSDREKYLIQADFYLDSEKTYNKALEVLESLTQIYPEDISGNNQFGILYARLGQYDKAVEKYGLCIKYGSEDVVIFRNQAQAYALMGLFDEAIRVLEKYLNTISDSAFIHNRLAGAYMYKGEYDNALAEAEKALSMDPEDWQYIRRKGDIFLYMGDLLKAEEQYNLLLKAKGPVEYAWGLSRMASLDLLQGKYQDARDRAIKGLEHAERLGQNVWTRRGLGFLSYLQHRLGNPQQALDSLNEAWRTAVEDEDTLNQRLILHGKALMYLEMGSAEKARDEAVKLKALNDQGMNKRLMASYYHLMGRIELGRKEYSKAIENFKMGLPLLTATDVRHLNYSDSLGFAYYSKGELNNAQREYEKISQLTVGRFILGDIYAKSFYMLGKIFEEQNNKTIAIEHYEKFLNLWKDADPGIPELEDASKRLAGLKK